MHCLFNGMPICKRNHHNRLGLLARDNNRLVIFDNPVHYVFEALARVGIADYIHGFYMYSNLYDVNRFAGIFANHSFNLLNPTP